MSWTGKAWRYVSWGLAALLGKIFMLFPSTEGIWDCSLSGTKSRINGHHPQSDHRFVGETKNKKSHWFSEMLPPRHSRTQTGYIQIQLLVCLWSVIHIIGTGNLPQALNEKGRERVCIAPRLRAKELTKQIFFPHLLCGTFSSFPFNIYWMSISCARLANITNAIGLCSPTKATSCIDFNRVYVPSLTRS